MYLFPNKNHRRFTSLVKPYLSEGDEYNKCLGSFAMHAAFERKKGRREYRPKGVTWERQTREKSVREGKEKMVVFTKGKSNDGPSFCLLLC